MSRTHGQYRSPTYSSWRSMTARCRNPNVHNYANYGGRGVVVCTRWQESFAEFVADMGERPSRNHTLDLINPAGNYEPGNCRWATRSEQAQNRSIPTCPHCGKEIR